ncbi:D-alanine--D-alanine ligase [Pseudoteredinibacter isoporae]|uniref:D-alanine--D-alanine ligase n=1 Tax=Pseudoteredinibacter isoporae TaxID=570281 RepID=A0A7X0JV58_9GAMM|nr:D-alanine--D-alanine ligase [Pseudoteredinibacter isoporae]MBB6522727.1 D-alanine-D-alanine ligase [Pseudoteredinibacter isoporae]
MSTTVLNDKQALSQALSGLGRVAVLLGGESAEREVSLQSGQAILEALQKVSVDAFAMDIGANAIEMLEKERPDHAFIALHGGAGEDGRMQALLGYLGIPFTGSGVNASAHAMDKLRCKYLWRGMGLSTPEFAVLEADSDWEQVIGELGGAVMVKPASEGSSIGMAPANSAAELKAAYENAAQYDRCVIAERLITGAEYTIAVLSDEVLPPIKLETDNQFYDYDAKYISEETRYLCPCGLAGDREEELKQLAKQAFDSLDCKDWGRVDVMADEEGNFYLLEVNTVPGMTSHSLVPMAAKAAGKDFEHLVAQILYSSLVGQSGQV